MILLFKGRALALNGLTVKLCPYVIILLWLSNARQFYFKSNFIIFTIVFMQRKSYHEPYDYQILHDETFWRSAK